LSNLGKARIVPQSPMRTSEGSWLIISELDYQSAIHEGIRLRTAGDYGSAMGLLVNLTVEQPRNVMAYLEAGRTQYAGKQLAPAMDWFKQAETIAPHNFWPYFMQAEVLQALSQNEQALGVLEIGLAKCNGRVSDLKYTNLIKRFIDTQALCLEAGRAGAPAFLAHPPLPGRPLPGALQATVVKDADDIIFASLDASYQAGIRYFAIADNESSDATRSEIERFRKAHADCIVLLLTDPIMGHFQAAKTMGLVRLASTVLEGLGIALDWIFPLDADELLYVSPDAGDLAGLLASERAAAKKILVYHHANAMSPDIHEALPVGADVVKLFPAYARLGRVPVRKVAFRNLAAAYVEEGNHFCSGIVGGPGDIISGMEAGVFLRHFPMRSLSQMRSKVVNGGNSIAAVANPGIGAHWRVDFENYQGLGDAYLLRRIQDYNAMARA